MSMLAERKRKQKWSLNPRGKAWSEDANKFGQKILEKMGWKQGKGLGLKEDGILENVKVAYKNDSKGMGYNDSDGQWTEHQDNFSSLLKSLAGNPDETSETKKPDSLEVKSQSSRARVHYHKFTRSKDLSKYSEKDLANIFGKKSLKSPVKEIVRQGGNLFDGGYMTDYFKNKRRSSAEQESKLYNGGSMTDYFKNKKPSFGMTVDNKKDESETESELKTAGFGYKSEHSQNTDFEDLPNGTSDDRNPSISERKPSFTSYIEGYQNKKRKSDMNDGNSIFSPKKKTKKNAADETKGLGLTNPAFDPLNGHIEVQKHTLDVILETSLENSRSEDIEITEPMVTTSMKSDNKFEENNKNRKPKKKKYRVSEETDGEEREQNIYDTSFKNDDFGLQKITSKSKKNKECLERTGTKSFDRSFNGVENLSFHNLENEKPLPRDENPYEVKLNKKKMKVLTTDMSKSAVSEESKAARKRSKVKDIVYIPSNEVVCQNVFENPNFEDGIESPENSVSVNNNTYEVIPKSKRRKASAAVLQESIGSDVNSSEMQQPLENPYEVKVKPKKKKKKKKRKTSTDLAIDNPNFNPNDLAETEAVKIEMENNLFELKPKKKKKRNNRADLAADNPTFDPNDSRDAKTWNTENNMYEIKSNKKKNNRPSFEHNDLFETSTIKTENVNSLHEVKPRKKKKKTDFAIINPSFNHTDSPETNRTSDHENVTSSNDCSLTDHPSEDIEESDLILNIVTTPPPLQKVVKNTEENDLILNMVMTPLPLQKAIKNMDTSSTKLDSAKKRKSVRFSDITEEIIILNNDDLRRLEAEEGIDNANFDELQTNLDENVEHIANTIDNYQAEIENDMNEKKLADIVIGEIGNPYGENELTPEGTKLKFKYAQFNNKRPLYQDLSAKKSYKHLIKGDIVVKFKNANLHEIDGYARNKNKRSVMPYS